MQGSIPTPAVDSNAKIGTLIPWSVSHPGHGEEVKLVAVTRAECGARVQGTGRVGSVESQGGAGESRLDLSRLTAPSALRGACLGSFQAVILGPIVHSAPPSAPRLLGPNFPAQARMADKKLVVVFGATGKRNPNPRPGTAGALIEAGLAEPRRPLAPGGARLCVWRAEVAGGRGRLLRLLTPRGGHGDRT